MTTETWALLDALSGACLAAAACYAAFRLVQSYIDDCKAKRSTVPGEALILTRQADTRRKLGSLLPMPLGLTAAVGAFLAVVVGIHKLHLAILARFFGG